VKFLSNDFYSFTDLEDLEWIKSGDHFTNNSKKKYADRIEYSESSVGQILEFVEYSDRKITLTKKLDGSNYVDF
jgi:hypothetical protein